MICHKVSLGHSDNVAEQGGFEIACKGLVPADEGYAQGKAGGGDYAYGGVGAYLPFACGQGDEQGRQEPPDYRARQKAE